MKYLTVVVGFILGLGLTVSALYLPIKASANRDILNTTAPISSDSPLAVATFAGGCFWCVEAAFEKVPGVTQVISGYTGGTEVSPTYQQVSSGSTGHTEAVQVHYDESAITYEGLLQALWRTADPTDNAGQYVDRGKQYRPEIFYHNESQQRAAILSRQALNDSGRYKKPVVIGITLANDFYPAEKYHQDYYVKNPIRYKFYTRHSGRYQFIDSVWADSPEIDYANYQPGTMNENNSFRNTLLMTYNNENTNSEKTFNADTFVKPSDSDLKKRLSGIEYKVTQKDGTERAFSNALHEEKRVGLYVDIISGEPLFASVDKFDSGTGWPSFSRPIAQGVVVEKKDRSLFGTRTEIRSSLADSHLGHVFNDGPAPTGHRYCMNAAAMRFVPIAEMNEAGYANYIGRVSGNSVKS